MNWNQATCETCWEQRYPGRIPIRVRAATATTCSYCGGQTASGIYVREHPDRVPHPQPEDRP